MSATVRMTWRNYGGRHSYECPNYGHGFVDRAVYGGYHASVPAKSATKHHRLLRDAKAWVERKLGKRERRHGNAAKERA